MVMRVTLLLCCALVAALPVLTSAQSPGWRGITPLRSTRADVERLLGEGWDKNGYYLKDGNVFFHYTSGTCENGGSGNWNVPPNTVLSVTVYLKGQPKLSDLAIDVSNYEKHPNIGSLVDYVNRQEGILLEVNDKDGRVQGIYYLPTEADEGRRCPGYDGISYSSDIPKDVRVSLLENLRNFVEYHRTYDYEKQYKMYLPEFAAKMIGAKDEKEFAEWMRGSNGDPYLGGTMQEFKVKSVITIKDETYGKAYEVYGLAKTLDEGKRGESYRKTRLVLRQGRWYFISRFELLPL